MAIWADIAMKPIRDPAYLAWVRTLPCWICGRRPCDAHHALVGAMAQKCDDTACLPLCRTIGTRQGHHDMADNRKEFARKFNLDIPAIIRELNRRYWELQIEQGAPRLAYSPELIGAELRT
jgi:hypothetical protein